METELRHFVICMRTDGKGLFDSNYTGPLLPPTGAVRGPCERCRVEIFRPPDGWRPNVIVPAAPVFVCFECGVPPW